MKTLAIKLEDSTHSQLTAIAQLEEQPITLLIKQAVEEFIQSKRNQPELTARAEPCSKKSSVTPLPGARPSPPCSGQASNQRRRPRRRRRRNRPSAAPVAREVEPASS